ncbi:hypothetical protein ACHAXA_000513 [Cyclostephanos tholiformis]|uniref:Uncharacterized protein n=1 Tax=Cyclostephanos tholiformis TaxID=382380 RepID=A0ABD3ST94_9STRA
MPPRRTGRRHNSAYKKGDYVEYQYKGSTVTGKLVKKSTTGTAAKPIWIINPSDRRRKNEEIPEGALGKIINAQEAMTNRAPKLKKSDSIAPRGSSPSSSNSNESPQSEDNSQGKRKIDESDPASGSERANKAQKTVTFSQESNATSASRKKATKVKMAKSNSSRIGTRSTGEVAILPELPMKKKPAKEKRVKKDENVTIVKMLTGTLYLYRGDRPRAEFVRSK